MIHHIEEVHRPSICEGGQGVEDRMCVAREAGCDQMDGIAVGVRQRRVQGRSEVSSRATGQGVDPGQSLVHGAGCAGEHGLGPAVQLKPKRYRYHIASHMLLVG